MEKLLKAIEKALTGIVNASSETVEDAEIHEVSKAFYLACRRINMRRKLILRIATGIIDALTEDMKTLEKNISEKR